MSAPTRTTPPSCSTSWVSNCVLGAMVVSPKMAAPSAAACSLSQGITFSSVRAVPERLVDGVTEERRVVADHAVARDRELDAEVLRPRPARHCGAQHAIAAGLIAERGVAWLPAVCTVIGEQTESPMAGHGARRDRAEVGGAHADVSLAELQLPAVLVSVARAVEVGAVGERADGVRFEGSLHAEGVKSPARLHIEPGTDDAVCARQ